MYCWFDICWLCQCSVTVKYVHHSENWLEWLWNLNIIEFSKHIASIAIFTFHNYLCGVQVIPIRENRLSYFTESGYIYNIIIILLYIYFFNYVYKYVLLIKMKYKTVINWYCQMCVVKYNLSFHSFLCNFIDG